MGAFLKIQRVIGLVPIISHVLEVSRKYHLNTYPAVRVLCGVLV